MVGAVDIHLTSGVVGFQAGPGSFKAFCQTIGRRGITEFNYRFDDPDEAHIFVGVKLSRGDEERVELVRDLEDKGYPVLDMTDNEMAKLHIRYMVGGHGPEMENEVLFRFEFPERPGALLQFLSATGARWNISLFHYRNHGDAFGRVLIGIQVPAGERTEFDRFLDQVGYRHQEETRNPAYRLFLS